MSTRLDTSPEKRLRHLASALRLSSDDVDEALAVSMGDLKAAEQFLCNLTTRPVPSRFLTREERIRKASAALATTPDALDIIVASLSKVLASPQNERLRKVNVNVGVFKERVSSKNKAGVELLYAVGYEPMHGHLVLQTHDPATLTAALSELARAKELPVYREAKAVLMGEKARREASEKEAAAADARRAAHLAKVPAEPAEGGASTACVVSLRVEHAPAPTSSGPATEGVAMGEEPAARVTRRFESDNTLDDLVHYIRSLSAVPDGVELRIENVTTRPARELDPARDGNASLYALDLWPRGQVRVVPARA